MMEATFTTTLDDYVACCLHVLYRSPSVRRKFALNWAVPPVLALGGAALAATAYFEVAVGLVAGAIGHAVTYPSLTRRRVERSIRKVAEDLGTGGAFGLTRMTLSDKSMFEQSATTQSVTLWQDMKGVEVVGDCVYVYVTGLHITIIPRHGFERTEDYNAVRDFVLSKLGTGGRG